MSAPPDRLTAALAGRYRIERELGAGGMATVYLAHDEKHDRKVAIKVLKPELAAVLGAERFVVEIKTTASLSHPHILPLFDSGTADEFLFYVMPYIQGETIREKLNRETQFGVDDAVRIAREVADALDYAHRHGVIHRDIKPENILLHDGRAMVMDFGIALAVSAAGGSRMTETGLSLGTPHYMSPEQATAEKDITPRSDVYSLASVLYEMLAGQPPHVGGPAQQVIMRIITEPARPVNEFRKNVPANVVAALATALEKLPADRFENAKAFGEALANPLFAASTSTGATGVLPGSRVSERRAWGMLSAVLAAGVLIGVAIAVPLAARRGRSPADPHPMQFVAAALGPRQAQVSGGIAISADGRDVVFVGTSEGTSRLYHRSLDALDVRALPGTEGAAQTPVITPDGTVFFTTGDGAIKRVQLSGGPVRRYAMVAHPPVGMSWSPQSGLILGMRSGGTPNGLTRIAEGDTSVVRITSASDDRRSYEMHHWPYVLDGGEYALFVHLTQGADRGGDQIAIASLRDGTWKRLGIPGRQELVVGVARGVLLYLTDDSRLMAVAWDDAARTVKGAPIAVPDLPEAVTAAAMAPDGTLAMRVGAQQFVPVVVDEHGNAEPLMPGGEATDEFFPRYSPDGRHAAFASTLRGTHDVWQWDFPSGPLSQLRFGFRAAMIDWTSDGRVVAGRRRINADPSVSGTLFSRSASAGDSARVFYKYPATGEIMSAALSRDQRTLAIAVSNRDSSGSEVHLSLVRFAGDTIIEPFAAAPAPQSTPRFSHDGRWLAYESIEAGRRAVYVRPVQGQGPRVQVSDSGGTQPVWAPDGRRIFYRNGRTMIAADVTVGAGTISVTRRAHLFDGDFFTSSEFLSQAPNYDVAPDGRHFLMARAADEGAGEVVIATGWLDKVKAQLAAKPK